jgi:hypothetical protein
MVTDGDRRAWAAGIVFVVALVTEGVIATGVGLAHDDGPGKVARNLHEHRDRLLVVAYLSIVYAVAFVVYLWKLHGLLRRADPRGLSTFVLLGGVLFVTLHGVSDIGITGLLGAKLASYGQQHDPGLSYALYYMTFALDSVGDVFFSLGFAAAAVLIFQSGVLPGWLGWVAAVAAPLLFIQGFGLGGVIATYGLAVDLVGFLLLLVFVAASSAAMLRRYSARGA